MLQTFNVPAGGRQVDAKATFFRYESCSATGADESLRVRADGNDLGTYMPGDSIRLPVHATRWELVPLTAAATAIVRLGVAGVDSARLVGTVNVVDTKKALTLAGQAYMVSGSTGVVAAQRSRFGVWVPLGVTKRMIIERISFQTTGAATTFLTGFTIANLTVSDTQIRSKLSGAANSASGALRCYDNNAAAGINSFMHSQIGVTSAVIEPKTPIIVKPGNGFIVVTGIDRDISVDLDVIEEDDV